LVHIINEIILINKNYESANSRHTPIAASGAVTDDVTN